MCYFNTQACNSNLYASRKYMYNMFLLFQLESENNWQDNTPIFQLCDSD